MEMPLSTEESDVSGKEYFKWSNLLNLLLEIKFMFGASFPLTHLNDHFLRLWMKMYIFSNLNMSFNTYFMI